MLYTDNWFGTIDTGGGQTVPSNTFQLDTLGVGLPIVSICKMWVSGTRKLTCISDENEVVFHHEVTMTSNKLTAVKFNELNSFPDGNIIPGGNNLSFDMHDDDEWATFRVNSYTLAFTRGEQSTVKTLVQPATLDAIYLGRIA